MKVYSNMKNKLTYLTKPCNSVILIPNKVSVPQGGRDLEDKHNQQP